MDRDPASKWHTVRTYAHLTRQSGYMSEFQVEQLARDAKVLQIYAGTDEIQITHIAKDLLRR